MDDIIRVEIPELVYKGTNTYGTSAKEDVLLGKTFYSNSDKPLTGRLDLSKYELILPPQEKTVYPMTTHQEVLPDENYKLSKVIVEAVTSSIDSNINPMNIKRGVSILGVEGNLEPDKPDQEKTVTPTEQEQIIRADTGFELSQVIIEAISENYVGSAVARKNEEIFLPIEQDRIIDANTFLEGIQTIKGMKLEEKIVDPTESEQIIEKSNEYDAIKKITINPISNTFIGSAITRKSAETFEFSEEDRTINASQYLEGSQLIKGAKLQDKVVTPSEEQQTISSDSEFNALKSVTVNAIPSDYVASGVARENERTITPTTQNQVINAKTYLEGQQTIAGDENLKPENIAQGKTIFGVVGTAQTATRDENETMYEMQEIDYMRFLSSEIPYYDIPTSSEYQTQQNEVNQIINQLIGEEI